MNRVLLSFFLLLVSTTSIFSQSLDVSSCPTINKRSNGNGQSSSAAGIFPGYGQNNPVATNVVGTKYQTVSYAPSVKTGDLTLLWVSPTSISKLPVITRAWYAASGSSNATLTPIVFGPPPPPTVSGNNYYVKYCFYLQNMAPQGTITLEFADPQTNSPVRLCSFDIGSGSSTSNPTITCTPSITTQPSNRTLCASTATSFSVVASGASSYQWQVTSDTTSSWTNITNGGNYSGATSDTLKINNPNTYNGSYYRVVCTGNSGCGNTNSNAVKLISNSVPTAAFTNSSSLCGLSTKSLGITLSGTAPWSVTYTTNGGSATTINNITSSPYYISVNPAITSTYALTSVSDANCTNSSLSGNTSVTVYPTPTISASAAAICYGSSSFSLTYSASNASTYSITAGTRAMTGFSPVSNANLTGSPLTITIPSSGYAAGTYDFNITVTNSTSGCVSAVQTFTLVVNANPSVSASSNAYTICNGTSATLTANGATTYSWSPSTGLSSISGASVTASPTSTTTYTVTGTTSSCTATSSVTITVNAKPTLSISASSTSICSGTSASLTASGANTYSWTGPSSYTATGSTIVVSPTSTGRYFLTGTNSNGCTDTTGQLITISAKPTVSISAKFSAICSGTVNDTLTASGATTYVWSPSTGLSATTGTKVVARPTSTTNYKVFGTTSGCTDSTSVTITVNSSPVTKAPPRQLMYCAADITGNNTVSYSITSPSAQTYTWERSTDSVTWTAITSTSGGQQYYRSEAAGTSVATSTIAIKTPGSGDKYFRVSLTTGSCTSYYYTTLKDVTNQTGFSRKLIDPDQSICSGSTPSPINFYGYGTVGSTATTAYTYQFQDSSAGATWTNRTGTWSRSNGDTIFSFAPSALTITTYYRVKFTGGSCAASTSGYYSDTAIVTVNAALASNSLSIANACISNQQIVGTAISLATYSWESSSDNVNFYSEAGVTTQSYTPPTPLQTKYFRRTATSGCSSTSSAIAVYPPITTTNISNGQSVCSGITPDSLRVTPSEGPSNSYTYLWKSSSNGSTYSNTAITASKYLPSSSQGTNYYKVIITSGACSDSSNVAAIVVNANPTVSVTPTSRTVCSGDSISITASGASSYAWSPSNDLSSTTGATVVTKPTATRTYTVTGTNSNGCTNTATSTITFNSSPSAPSANSPSSATICSSSAPYNLNSLITGGTSVVWRSVPDTSSSYSVSNSVSTSGTYYAYSKSGACYSSTNANVSLTVSDVSKPSVSATTVTLCSPSTANLTSLQPAVPSGTRLEWHTVSSTPTALTKVADSSQVVSGTYYLYAYSLNAACYGPASNAVTVTINSLPTATVGSSPSAVCAPNTINLENYNTTGNNANTYSWYTVSSNPSPASLVSNPSAVSVSGTYYLYAKSSSGCLGGASSPLTVAINNNPTDTISSPAPVCGGAASTISVTTDASTPTHLWEVSSNGGTSWSTVSNGGIYSGATSATLSISNTTNLQGYYFRNTVTGSGSCSTTSSSAIVISEAAPAITNQPVNVSAGVTYNTSFSVSTSGNFSSNYQWQISTNNGSTFNNLLDTSLYTGSTTSTLQINSVVSRISGNKYRCIITNSCNTLTSSSATLTTNVCTPPTPTFTTSPASSICNNTSVTYKTQSLQSNYVWTVSGTVGVDYTITSGGIGSTDSTVTLTWLTAGSKTVTVNYNNSGGCTGTSPATSDIMVNAITSGTASSAQGTLCTGGNTTLTLSDYTVGATIQWQQSLNGTTGWTNVTGGSGATSASYTTSNLTSTTYYRAVVSNDYCSVNSSTVTITVNATSVGGTASATSSSLCTGNLTTITLNGYTGTIQWQQSSNGSTGWTNVTGGSGATSASYTTPTLTSTTYYRAVVTNGVCTSANSTTASVTIKQTSTSTKYDTACVSYLWNGVTYTTSGTKTWTGTNSVGCDSTATLYLTIKQASTSTKYDTACVSFLWNGTTYTTSGTKTWTGTNSAGCDSTATLYLTIKQPSTGDTTAFACNSFTWYGTTYTSTPVLAPTKTFTNKSGCDSVVTLNLTIGKTNTGDTTAFACNSFTWYGTTYTSSATPTHTFTNASGCDSVVTLHLTVGHANTGDTTAFACNSFVWYGSTYTSSATPTHTFTNASGCDSVVTLHLTVGHANTGDTTAIACNSFTWYGTTYTTTPVVAPTKTFTNKSGCDSVVTLNLTIGKTNTGDTTAFACNSFTWYGTTYTSTPVVAPTKTFTNKSGCDSVVTLNLTIGKTNTGDTTAFACNSFTWYGTTYTSSATPTHTFTNTSGCDSVVTLNLTIGKTNTGDTTAIACNSFTWYGTTYTTTPVVAPTKTFTNKSGCDSVVTLHLTIGHTNTGDTTVSSCDSFTWYGTTYTSSTFTPTHTFINASGCDSLVTLHLTIKGYSSTRDTSAFACNSFTWYGTTYTSSATPTHTFTNASGCDSLVTLHLIVGHANTGDTTAFACNSFDWYGITYTSSGTPTHTFTNASGCDSVVTLKLTIGKTNTGDTTAFACNSFDWFGTTYTSSGTPTHTFTNASGCDSVVTLKLTIGKTNTGDTTAFACNSFDWYGTTYTSSGTPTHTFTNASGCDSVVTLHLTVNYSNTGDTTAFACNSFTWYGTTYTSSATPTHTFTNASGCDSVVTLHLTVGHANTGDTIAFACNSFTWYGTTYTSSGTPTHIFTNASGCDSVVTLDLTVGHANTGDTTAFACNSFVWYGTTYTSSTNTPTYSFTNASGCDSVVTLHLTVNYSNTGDTTAFACNSFDWYGTTYTSSATPTHTFTNASGCDSVVTLHLTVGHANTGDTIAFACNSFTWYGTTYTASTSTPTNTFTNASGCDSVVTLHLTIGYTNTGDTAVTTCDSFTWYETTYTTSSNPTHTFTNASGCDSVVTLQLTIKGYSNTGDTTAFACNSFIWYGITYTTSSTPTHTFTNASGCDSVVTLHLTVGHANTGDTSVYACNSFTWYGITYTSSTSTPTYTFTNASGCDSVVTLNLKIGAANTGDTTAFACDSFTWYGTNYSTTPTVDPTRTFTNQYGCDSVVTLHLTVGRTNTGDTIAFACNSFTWYGITYTSSSTPTRTFTNKSGCDSVVKLWLSIGNTNTGDTTAFACNSFTWYGTTYTTSSTPTRTFKNVSGCDSVVTLKLKVGYSNKGDTTAFACNSFTWYGTTYTTSSTPTRTFKNASGCDSLVTLNLTISNSPVTPSYTISQPNCSTATATVNVMPLVPGLTYSVDGSNYSNTNGVFSSLSPGGIYFLTAKNNMGCVSGSRTITVDSIPANPSAPTLSVVQPSCSVTTGTLNIVSSTNSLSFSINNSAYSNSTYSYSGLTAGVYSIRAKNTLGCVSNPSTATITSPLSLSTVFNVTGGGTYYPSLNNAVPVGISGSQIGVSYQLKLSGNNYGTPVSGTGAPISFGNMTIAGNYTVVATNLNSSCTTSMSGSVNVFLFTENLSTFSITPVTQTVCSGSAISNILISNFPSGVTFGWTRDKTTELTGMSSVGTGIVISGVLTNRTSIAQTVTFTIKATSAFGSTYTKTARVTINPQPSITTQPPVNITKTIGQSTSISLVATGLVISYQWFLSTNSGLTWNRISNSGSYSGATTSTLNISNLTTTMNRYRYRCIVTGQCSPTGTSVTTELLVQASSIVKTAQIENNPHCFNINVFPNPTFDNFKMIVSGANETEVITYKITDVQGRFIKGGTMQPNELLNIDNKYSSGIYFIEVNQGILTRKTKLIKY